MSKYCPKCKGTGFVLQDTKGSQEFFCKLVHCPMCNKQRFKRRKKK